MGQEVPGVRRRGPPWCPPWSGSQGLPHRPSQEQDRQVAPGESQSWASGTTLGTGTGGGQAVSLASAGEGQDKVWWGDPRSDTVGVGWGQATRSAYREVSQSGPRGYLLEQSTSTAAKQLQSSSGGTLCIGLKTNKQTWRWIALTTWVIYLPWRFIRFLIFIKLNTSLSFFLFVCF